MTVSRFCAGFALFAATACTQGPRAYVPPAPAATGYVSPGYVSPGYVAPEYVQTVPVQTGSPRYIPSTAVPGYAPPLPAATIGSVTTTRPQVVQSYAAPPAALQRVPAYDAQPPRYLPAEPPVVTNVARAYAPAPDVAPAPAPATVQPPAYSPPAYTAAAIVQPAPALPPAPVRAPVVAYGKDVPPPRTNRRFTAISGTKVAELASRRQPVASRPQTITPSQGMQVTTAEPFSIPTSPTGKPYYLGSTPPAIEYHIPHIPQEEPLWCWAAAAQQAIGWVNKGRAPSQCAIVALAHGLNVQECCSDREGICARTGEIPAIATLVERFGGEARELASVPRDPQTIYDILRKGDTLLIRLRPAPHDEAVGIRHMIVVRGIEWLRLPNNQLQATLLYNDPLGAGERAVNFDEIEGFFEQALVVSRI